MRVLILGAGRVGARTLSYLLKLLEDAEFYVIDADKSRLDRVKGYPRVTAILYDSAKLMEIARRSDLVVSALPSSIAYKVISEVAGSCADIVDVSFFEEDPFALGKIAEKCGSRIVVDAGFAPGYSNIVAGYAFYKLGMVDDIEIAVGGIPSEPIPPIGYAVTWNARDLLEEYTRPARYVENGEVKAIDPLSTAYRIDIEGLGALEGFVSDGLRTMLRTIKARNLREITLRWPGHISAIRLLRDLGFLDEEEITINGSAVKPIDFTAQVLERRLRLEVGDIAVLAVRASDGGGRAYREIAILRGTPGDPATPAFTALVHAFTASLIAREDIGPGLLPPELLYGFKERYTQFLRENGVAITEMLMSRG